MQDTLEEKRRFATLMTGLSDYYRVEISKAVMALYWEGLKRHPFEAVESAMWAHTQNTENGQFMPKIADVVRILQRDNDNLWIGPDEAWALVPKSESDSAMLTDEIAQAVAAATPLLEVRDKVAARMAFKDAYTRLVERAKAEGRAPRYFPSFGTEPSGRVVMLADAVRKKQIALEAAVGSLPEFGPDIVRQCGLTEHPLLAPPKRENVDKLKALMLTLKAQA